MSITYYTDGSAKGNGTTHSSGGYGVVAVNEKDNIIWADQGIKAPTTNNEMELMAILKALEYINNNQIETFFKPIIYSDSAYCVNLINTWMYSWERNGWRRPQDQEVKNLDIIKKIYQLAHLAEVRKVPGHSGIKWNEYCDGLATGRIKLQKNKGVELLI